MSEWVGGWVSEAQRAYQLEWLTELARLFVGGFSLAHCLALSLSRSLVSRFFRFRFLQSLSCSLCPPYTATTATTTTHPRPLSRLALSVRVFVLGCLPACWCCGEVESKQTGRLVVVVVVVVVVREGGHVK